METKKNPPHDVHRQRSTLLVIGLLGSISLVITAFEWETEVPPQTPRPQTEEEMVFFIPELPHSGVPEPARPRPVRQQPKMLHPTPVEESTAAETPERTLSPDIIEAQTAGVENLFDEPLDTATYFAGTAEFAPHPVGGYTAFYRMIAGELKYPRAAIRNGTEGKVYVEFVVNPAGAAQNIRVIKGIGSGCDEEAARVLALSRWEPGRQRGRLVKVRMVLPVQFVID